MSPKKYPLDPLAKLRHRQVDAQARELAKAVGTRQDAERTREGAEDTRARADAGARAVRDEERKALEDGTLRAGDLHRAQAWELGVELERRRLTDQVNAAVQNEHRAQEAEDEAQRNLAAREAGAEVVDEDKARFVAREKARDLAKEEEASQEAHEASRRERWRREQ
jgi:hypothetical protein